MQERTSSGRSFFIALAVIACPILFILGHYNYYVWREVAQRSIDGQFQEGVDKFMRKKFKELNSVNGFDYRNIESHPIISVEQRIEPCVISDQLAYRELKDRIDVVLIGETAEWVLRNKNGREDRRDALYYSPFAFKKPDLFADKAINSLSLPINSNSSFYSDTDNITVYWTVCDQSIIGTPVTGTQP